MSDQTNCVNGPERAFWRDLDDQTQADLLAWLNVQNPFNMDRERLAELYSAGRFKAWACPGCGNRCYRGEPESWDRFQGVVQVDYSSYSGDLDKYQPDYNARLCDDCRCWGVPAMCDRCPSDRRTYR